MTRIEKVAEIRPDLIGNEYIGGVFSCPDDSRYDFLNIPELVCLCEKSDSPAPTAELCKKCWDTEYLEDSNESKNKK